MATIYIKIEASDNENRLIGSKELIASLKAMQFPDRLKTNTTLTLTHGGVKANIRLVTLGTSERVQADTRYEDGRVIIPSKLNYE